MALSMARPWQHPETGTFYLRQRVPQDVLTRAKGQRLTLAIGEQAAAITIGKIVQVSLRTKDRQDSARGGGRRAQALLVRGPKRSGQPHSEGDRDARRARVSSDGAGTGG